MVDVIGVYCFVIMIVVIDIIDEGGVVLCVGYCVFGYCIDVVFDVDGYDVVIGQVVVEVIGYQVGQYGVLVVLVVVVD